VISTDEALGSRAKPMTKLVCLLTIALGACGDNELHPDAHIHEMPDAWSPAAHEPQPTAQSFGGPVLASPKVVPVFFAGDETAQNTIETFLIDLAASSYWPTVVNEYHVGALTIEQSVVTSDPPPTTDMALQTWIEMNTSGSGTWPPSDSNTLYVVFLPTGASLTAGFGKSCVDFGGYHSETTPGGELVYALIPRCTSTTANPLDPVTGAASHELVEASTDPHFYTAPAYRNVDTAHFIWGDTPGAEVGDMCEFVDAAFQPLVNGFLVQRIWSNESGAASHDPCVPVLAQPYTAAAPLLSSVEVTPKGSNAKPFMTDGVIVNYGTPVTVEVDLFSDSETAGEFVVSAQDATTVLGGSANLEFQWDDQYGQNGTKRHLIITRTTPGNGGASEFVIFAFQNNISVAEWWGYVGGK
jgi:hypothetical protein